MEATGKGKKERKEMICLCLYNGKGRTDRLVYKRSRE